MKKVSIIIPCYNEEKYIVPCLDSIVANDYPKDLLEIIVVDGMSNDGTRAILSQYTEKYPFIPSNSPTWRRIVEGEQCGICVDPLNPEEIADAIIWLLDNQKEAERMGLRGRRAVEEKYDWGQEEKKLLKIYLNLLHEI